MLEPDEICYTEKEFFLKEEKKEICKMSIMSSI